MKQILTFTTFLCIFTMLNMTKVKQYPGSNQNMQPNQQGGYPNNQGGYQNNQGGYQNNQGGYPKNQGNYPNNYQNGNNQQQSGYNYNQSPPGQRPMTCRSMSDCMECGTNVKQCHQGTCFCCQGKMCHCQRFK